MRSAASNRDSLEQQEYLRQLAQEVVSRISEQDPSHSRELLAAFVAELLLTSTEQEQQLRRQKQLERVAEAKKRGVRFGRQRLALPEGFPGMARLWENGGISAGNAAAKLGMSRDTFLRRAREFCNAPSQDEKMAV